MREGYIGGRYDRIRSSSTSKLRLLPSQDIGEYEEPRRRKSAPEPRRPSGGGLFPLSEEGRYGLPPTRPPPPLKPLPGYERRERKPKVYASYAVSNECQVHGSRLEKNEEDKGVRRSSISSRPSSRASTSYSPSSSRPSSRASFYRTSSFSNDCPVHSTKVETNGKYRTSSQSPIRSKQSSTQETVTRKRSASNDKVGERNHTMNNIINNTTTTNNSNSNSNSNVWNNTEVKKSGSFNTSKYRSPSYKRISMDLRDTSFEENEEYEYENENKSTSSGGRKISLAALREPTFESESGILGLTSVMWGKIQDNQQIIQENKNKTNNSMQENKNRSNMMQDDWKMRQNKINNTSFFANSLIRKYSDSSHVM